jgi:hypothetical protein
MPEEKAANMINSISTLNSETGNMSSLDILHGYSIHAADGELGTVVSFLFEEHTWKIRFMVVDARLQAGGRRLLIPPAVFLAPVWEQKRFPLRILRNQVSQCPDIDSDAIAGPISGEENLFFGWPVSWGEGFHLSVISGSSLSHAIRFHHPGTLPDAGAILYAHRKLIGFTMDTVDGPAGDIVDFIIDENRWEICFLVVDTGTLLPGKKVLVSVDKIKKIMVNEGRVSTVLHGKDISKSPAFDPSGQFNHNYNKIISEYYNRSSRWGEDAGIHNGTLAEN